MGLTSHSTGINAIDSGLSIKKTSPADSVIAVAGNPNVGKSTLFNALTGMKQHTGNWPGKTVSNAQGVYKSNNKNYVLVDIPGTYSLLSHSPEEEVARNFICFGKPDAVIVVCDATCLERNLNLVLQTLEISENVIVCINLLDEAERKGIKINLNLLEEKLGVPIVGTVARKKKTLKSLISALDKSKETNKNKEKFNVQYSPMIEKAISIIEPELKNKIGEKINCRWLSLRILENDASLNKEIENFLGYNISDDNEVKTAVNKAKRLLYDEGVRGDTLSDMITSALVFSAEEICKNVVQKPDGYNAFDLKTDKFLTGRKFGYPVMILLLLAVFWLTISGANYISEILSYFFSIGENYFRNSLIKLNSPSWFTSMLIDGVYRIPAWVISVMLPPMAIFFPLFTLLEDCGYLPRIAYNLDKPFKKCHSCGKQALTMCMGFGCNAAGVTGCRIIDSPRERMLAIITNSLVPCNGRFPTIIAVITMFFVGANGIIGSFLSSLILTAVIVFSVFITFFATKFLSKTVFKGLSSSYTLEMPPYRKPKIGSVIVRSIFDRTLFVLGRSVAVAVPAGIIIWLVANLKIDGITILAHLSEFLDPFAYILGLDGVILLAFILGFPANEIVLPLAIMAYLSSGSIAEVASTEQMRQILVSNGWNAVTAISVIIFCLMHWPCSTTVLTIKKETGSLKWALFSILFPTALGIIFCMIIKFISYLITICF